MDFKELKKKKISDLNKLLLETREKLRDLRFKDANKQLKNVREIRQLRLMVARIMTLLNKEGSKKEEKPAAPEQAGK
ncbi:MAG: 50S ribosomal protein L29 [Planctomycetes bacterium]|jgi:large subunit ribosomal protein L29|nr:50S ribosomal protein L29 [Planctomycetota bacterium]